MPDLIVAADFGASLGRAIYTVPGSYVKPELMLIGPQVVRVPEKSIENYERYKIGGANPEDSAWVKIGDAYYAVGFLASKNFHAVHCLDSLKIDSAIPQTLALIGSVAQRKQLPAHFSLSLGILLPWSEFKDREKFQHQISDLLGDYTFRGQQFSVTLESFSAVPEGGGIFARGRVPKRFGEPLPNAKEVTIVVIMLGYRNSSILVIERGELTRGITGNLGFARMVERIQTFTSGQKAEILVPLICQVKRFDDKQLEKVADRLARTQEKSLRQCEIKEIGQALLDARQEYVQLLKNWIIQHLPSQSCIDEFLVSGGTARYFNKELVEFLKPFGGSINWCGTLEERITKTFGELVTRYHLESRLADAYGLFFQIQNKPLPRLRDANVEHAKAS